MNVALSVLLFLCVQFCYCDLNAITNEERNLMLKEHNNRRSGVLPTATNMLLMQWDFDLELLAAEQASLCVFEHGGLDGVNSTGQNIGASSSVDFNPENLLSVWFDEETPFFDINNPTNPASSHFTQVAWASSNRVGCSKSVCDSLSGFQTTGPAVFWVCNYQSQGNIAGSSVYKPGTPCTACPATHPVCIRSLCATGESDSDDDHYGAMTFPEGDNVKENTTKPATPEDFPPEDKLKREIDNDINATAVTHHHQQKQHKHKSQHKAHHKISKREVPSGGIDVPGDCKNGRFHTWVQVDRGSFSNNVSFTAVVVITLATQIYYTHAVEAPGGTESDFNEEPHLFSCVEDNRPMTVYVFNCAGVSEPCGEAYGVPMDLLPAYQFTLETWDDFQEGEEVELSGGPSDPRKLFLKFNYGESSSTNTGAIVAGCLVVLIIIAAVVGYFYWKKKQAEAPAYGHVDRV